MIGTVPRPIFFRTRPGSLAAAVRLLLVFPLFVLAPGALAVPQTPEVAPADGDGPFRHHAQFGSRWVAPRNVDVWKNWITRKFPGNEHSEKSWSRRVAIPLAFLLQK